MPGTLATRLGERAEPAAAPVPRSTTCTPALLSAGKSRLEASRSPGGPGRRRAAPARRPRRTCTPRIGAASTSSPAMIGSATRTGWRSTTPASRAQPVPARAGALRAPRQPDRQLVDARAEDGEQRRQQGQREQRGQRRPRPGRRRPGTSGSPAGRAAGRPGRSSAGWRRTRTVRPAVATVRVTASAGVRPYACSSRNRPDHEQPVVDRHAQPEQAGHVDRERVDVVGAARSPCSTPSEPSTAAPPTSTGSAAATSEPKMNSSRISTIGSEIGLGHGQVLGGPGGRRVGQHGAAGDLRGARPRRPAGRRSPGTTPASPPSSAPARVSTATALRLSCDDVLRGLGPASRTCAR